MILEDPHLLIGSSPGSLPHHEAFGWATLFVGGSSATARRPHISHLCLIFHNICHLTQNKLCKYQLTHTKHFLFWTLSGEGSLRIPLPGWGDGRWLHPQAQGDRWLSRGLGLQLHSGETWDQPEEFKREVKVCKNTESAVFGMTYSTNYNIIHFCMCAQLWLCCLAGLTFSLLIVFFVWGGEDFPPTPLCLCHYTQICRAATYTFSFHHPNLKLIHDLANALATGANDASMDPAVQGDVLRDHLFQLIHDGLNGISCSYGFVLIPCNSNLILWRHSRINFKKTKQKHPYTKHLARYRAPLSGSPFRFNTISHRHTWFSSFFSGNWMLTSCSVRMFVIMAPLRPIILGWYLGSTVMVSLKLLSACRGFEKRWQNVGLEFHKVWQLAISHYYSTWCLPKIRLIIKPFVHLRIMIRVPFELIWKD